MSLEMAEMLGEPRVEPVEAALHLQVLLPGEADVEAGRRKFTELEDAGTVVVWHPEDVSDHRDRQLRTVEVDDVDALDRTGLDAVEQAGGSLLNPLPQRRNGSGGEYRRNGLAVAGVLRRLHGQHRRRQQRMEPALHGGLLFKPPQWAGKVLADRGDREVIGAKELVSQRVVGGQPRRAAANELAALAKFVGEATGVGADRGVGDEPALHLTALGPERRQPTDDPVHGKPVQSLLERHDSSLSTGRRSSKRSKSCHT